MIASEVTGRTVKRAGLGEDKWFRCDTLELARALPPRPRGL
jgi:hypothetical protein